jgi:hypothetical protein
MEGAQARSEPAAFHEEKRVREVKPISHPVEEE